MAITLKTVNVRGVVQEALVERNQATHSTHFLEPSQGGVQQDISAGAVAGQTLTGTARTMVGGKDAVIVVHSAAAGTLAIEDSPDGNTWTQQAAYPLAASVEYGIRFTPGTAQYRAKFVAATAGSKVEVFSQNRT